ncbi:MAG: guanylate kinase [Bacteroidales bacterium]|nr:guanylate kinase [Bacteroidales bacterium]
MEFQKNYLTDGKCIIISAPSGAGKTTIVHSLLETVPTLEFSVSATSRKMRPGEKNGRDYYFLSPQEFKTRLNENQFLEWEEVYPDQFYGTLKSEVERIWKKGNHVIFDVDVYGGLNIKKYFKEKALPVYIMPPSFDVLKERLENRGTEGAESMNARMLKAKHELSKSDQFDLVVINDNLEDAIEDTVMVVKQFLEID